MCGITGFVDVDQLPEDAAARAVAMRDTLTHRGPDEAGLHCDAQAALAHRRLSIVDLDTGQQPLSNEDGTIWITYNGEIYNHADLRRDLEARGHRYKTRSDTETIVHAYEQWGDECVRRLRGMFAFAIWDAPRRRLLLVRDRLGVKPLYWALAGTRLLFASEMKAIFASGWIEPQPNTHAIPELLGTRYLSGSETMCRGVHKLMPGCLLVLEKGHAQVRQYWDLPVGDHDGLPELGRDPDDRRIADRFLELLDESVRLRLMSDVPLGMFLSGGIDSSAVAALMSRLVSQPVRTFSVAFKERAFNELEYSRQVARAIRADAHEIVIDDRDFFGALPRLVWHEDEPIAHPSSVPLYFVSKLAREHVKVVLTGEGSDELLAGYGKYPRAALNWRAGTIYERLVPRRIRESVARTLPSALPPRLARYVRRSFLAMDRTPESMIFDNFAAVRLADQRRLLAEPLRVTATLQQAYGSSAAYFGSPDGDSTFLDRLLYADVKTYLVELLMKQDQMSMATSIESRVPFLDHKLVEFAARLPDRAKLRGLATKRVLRAAMEGLLPRSILDRPKMGFPVPFGAWMRTGWQQTAREVLLDRRTRERGIIESAAVESLIADHVAGRIDAGDRIWSLMNLELWYRTVIDKEGVQTLPAPAPAAFVPTQAIDASGNAVEAGTIAG